MQKYQNNQSSKQLIEKEMAKILDIGIKSLSRIENGELPPRLNASVAVKIYQQFGITPSEITSVDIACKKEGTDFVYVYPSPTA